MPAILRVSRTVFAILISSLICTISTYSQGADSFLTASLNHAFAETSNAWNHRTISGAWLAKCAAPASGPTAVRAFPWESESATPPNEIGADSDAGEVPGAACAGANDSALPRARDDVPCVVNATRVQEAHATIPCDNLADTIAPGLLGLGKEGMKIERAREAVLDILRGANACSAWFETKDARPAATFQTIDFLIDRQGAQNTLASRIDESNFLVREPFVAQATQDGGPHTTITINAYGAFYRSSGTVQTAAFDGGPMEANNTRFLTVGGYIGNALPAQIVTLLHEFGHIIDLLPEDADNMDGQSVRNTNEVLRHCRAEIETEDQQAKRKARR